MTNSSKPANLICLGCDSVVAAMEGLGGISAYSKTCSCDAWMFSAASGIGHSEAFKVMVPFGVPSY